MVLSCGTYLVSVRVFVKLWVRLSADSGNLSLIPVSHLKNLADALASKILISHGRRRWEGHDVHSSLSRAEMMRCRGRVVCPS